MTRVLFHKVNVLSIDVALGSVCAALFFGKYVAVGISPVTLAVLALTVWIIYTVDHLMDAKRITGPALPNAIGFISNISFYSEMR
jgi:hypothetical protein